MSTNKLQIITSVSKIIGEMGLRALLYFVRMAPLYLGFCFPATVYADCNVTGNISIDLNTQAEIDAFQSTYSINGVCDGRDAQISIRVFGQDVITDLMGLSDLKEIYSLNIDGTLIESLDDLQLESLTGLWLDDNRRLSDISAIDQLATFEWIEFSGEIGLTDISGFNNLSSLGRVWIRTDSIESISGFQNAVSLSPDGYDPLVISGANLRSISGFQKLVSVGGISVQGTDLTALDFPEVINTGRVNIGSNYSLAVINFLSLDTVQYQFSMSRNLALTEVNAPALKTAGSVYIDENGQLESLSFLSNVTSVTGLKITENDKLTDVSGVINIAGIGSGGLEIRSNPLLSNCTFLAEVLGYPDQSDANIAGAVSVLSNAEGCNSVVEIFDQYALVLGAGDSDSDAISDDLDNCPTVFNPSQSDNDGDNVGDVCDSDDDNDGVTDDQDAFPLDGSESLDTDGDGVGNNTDFDDDGDGMLDRSDVYPLVVNSFYPDFDGDGVPDNLDDYPNDSSRQFAKDGDLDGDGWSNQDEVDYCANPLDRREEPVVGTPIWLLYQGTQ